MLKIKTLVPHKITPKAAGAALGLLLLIGSGPAARSASLGVDLAVGSTVQNAIVGQTMGYEFHLSTSATVSGLGFWDENGVYPTVDVGLWSLVPGFLPALIGSVSTSDHAVSVMNTGTGVGHWYFMSYSTALTPGDYVVGAFGPGTVSFALDLYRIQASTTGSLPLTTNVLTYTRDRYSGTGGETALAFPGFSNTNATFNYFFLGGNILLEPGGVTPLPAALPLFASGLGALGLLGWRRKRKNAARAAV